MAHDDDTLVEQIAGVIFLHQGGVTPDEYKTVMGSRQKAWKTAAPWDSQPDVELCEHERDEYRMQARAVLACMQKERTALREERDAYRRSLKRSLDERVVRNAAMHAEVDHLKELLDDDAFRKMRDDRDQLLIKVEQLRGKLAGITRDRNQILKERNTYRAEIERLHGQYQGGCPKIMELCDAIEADLGPLDDPDKCLCNIEVAEGVMTCSVCLARQYRAAISEKQSNGESNEDER